ncbi:hypothetical protein V8E54_009056 [Elaphomyces granulatus]
MAREHTLTWADTQAVEELEKPVAGFAGYISHDNPRQEVDASTIDDRQPGDSRQEVDDDFSTIDGRQPGESRQETSTVKSLLGARSHQPREMKVDSSQLSRVNRPGKAAQAGAVEDQEEEVRRKLRLATLARARAEFEMRKLEEELAAALSKKRNRQIEESEQASKRRR